MESPENNNEAQDQQPSDAGDVDQSPQPSPEYETHTTALVFLVIVAAIISFIALTGGEGINFSTDDSGTTQPTETGRDVPTHGSAVPQYQVETTDINSITNLPSGLFVDEAGIDSNKVTADGQQIVHFSTDRTQTDLYGTYEAWMTGADYEITQEVEDDYGAKLAALGPAGEQLTVSIARPDDNGTVRVMIDYVPAQ